MNNTHMDTHAHTFFDATPKSNPSRDTWPIDQS